jgi:chromosome segregation ATPase
VLIKVIARLISWYTAQMQDAQMASLSTWQTQADLNDRIAAAFSPDLAKQVQKLETELAAFRTQHRVEMDSVHARQHQSDAAEQELRNSLQKLTTEWVHTESGLASLTSQLAAASACLEELRQTVALQVAGEREFASGMARQLEEQSAARESALRTEIDGSLMRTMAAIKAVAERIDAESQGRDQLG